MSKKDTERLELKKYCDQCQSHTIHRETKQLEDITSQNHFMFGGQEMQGIGSFFREVGREMRKVSWPKRKELTSYTVTVLSTVVFFTLFFAVIDLGISNLIRFILE